MIAKKKNLGSRKFISKKITLPKKVVGNGNIISAINIERSENINDPKTPDKVFFGLIFVIFFHLNILPKK